MYLYKAVGGWNEIMSIKRQCLAYSKHLVPLFLIRSLQRETNDWFSMRQNLNFNHVTDSSSLPCPSSPQVKGEEQSMLWEAHKVPDYESRAWKPDWFDSHRCKDLRLGFVSSELESWKILYLIHGLRKPKCQSIMMFTIRGIERVWGLEWEYLSSSLSYCRKPSLTLLHPLHLCLGQVTSLFFFFLQCLLFPLSWGLPLCLPLSGGILTVIWEWGQFLTISLSWTKNILTEWSRQAEKV